MQVLDRYLDLYGRFSAETGGTGDAFEVTLGQIAEMLYCTERNAKLVLRKLSEEGFIKWDAGRGRGNRSKLTLLADKEKLLLVAAQELGERSEYNKAFELLREHGAHRETNERFIDWMYDRFGIREGQEEGKDVLRLPIYEQVVTVDPAASIYSLSGHLVHQLFDRLVSYEPGTDRFLPAIAHHWESSEDGRIWTFHLRKGIMFHNGKELTGEDVAFTFNRLRCGRNNSWMMRTLERVEAASPRIVQLYLSKPNYLFLRFMCSVAASILPNDYAGLTEEQYWRKPVGTGPFQMGSWTEEQFSLLANPHYYQGRPHLDAVDIAMLKRDGLADSKVGNLSWQQLLCEPEQREIKPENGWRQVESNACCTSVLTWNMNKEGPHQSAAFRQAVDRLIDRKAMLEELKAYRVRVAAGFFYDSAAAEPEKLSDPDEVRSLLERSGYKGQQVELCTYGKHAEDAEWIRRRCEEAGIAMNVSYEAFDRVHDRLNEADGIVHAIIFPEEEVCLIENYEQQGSFVHDYQQPETLEWIAGQIGMALACRELKERQIYYNAIENRLREESLVSFLLHSKSYAHSHPSFQGVDLSPNGWIEFKRIWRAE